MAEVKLDTASKDAKAYYEKAYTAMERGNLDYAMDMFEESLKIEPRLLQARKGMRACAMKKTAGKPASKKALFKAAATWMKATATLKKDPMAALELSERILRIDPLNLKFAKLQCDAAKMASMPEVAILTLETLCNQRGVDMGILKPLARLYRDTEQFQDEFECRTKIAELLPNDGQAQKELKDSAARLSMGKAGWQKAESYRELVRADDAEGSHQLQDLESRIEAHPEDLELRKKLADYQLRNKLYAEAIATLEDCESLSDGSDPWIEQKLQVAREHRLSFELAEAEDANDSARVAQYRDQLNALRIDSAKRQAERYPNDLQVKFEYGKLLFEKGDLTEAIQQFQLAKRNPQRRVRSLLYLAKAFRAKNQLQIAMDQLEAALADTPEMDSTKKELLYEMALLCEEKEDAEKSIAYLKEIYAVDIGYRDVARRIEQNS